MGRCVIGFHRLGAVSHRQSATDRSVCALTLLDCSAVPLPDTLKGEEMRLKNCGTLPRFRAQLFPIAALLVSPLLAASSAKANADPKFEEGLLSENRRVLFRSASSPLEKRWITVETQSFFRRHASDGTIETKFRGTQRIAIDCAIPGLKPLASYINVERDWTKSPSMAALLETPEFKQGFSSPAIEYTELDTFVENERVAFNKANAGRTSVSGNVIEIDSHFPIEEALALEFGCAVAVGGMTDAQAARWIGQTLGLPDSSALMCTVDMRDGTTRDVAIRFNERKGYLKFGPTWVLQRRFTPELLTFGMNNGLAGQVNRFTGKLINTMDGVSFEGQCKAFDGLRKF